MKQIMIVISTTALTFASISVRYKMGWLGLIPSTIELSIAMAIAMAYLGFISSGRQLRFGFRALIVTISLIFGTIVSNTSLQVAQMRIVGYTYVDGEPRKQKRVVIESEPNKMEEVAKILVEASTEEVYYRWVILGAMLMLMPSALAIILSSIIFAVSHALIPILAGHPDIGLLAFAPTFAIGIFCGIAFLKYGLLASIFIHVAVNFIPIFRSSSVSDVIIYGSAATALLVLPVMLVLTQLHHSFKRRKRSHPLRAAGQKLSKFWPIHKDSRHSYFL